MEYEQGKEVTDVRTVNLFRNRFEILGRLSSLSSI